MINVCYSIFKHKYDTELPKVKVIIVALFRAFIYLFIFIFLQLFSMFSELSP